MRRPLRLLAALLLLLLPATLRGASDLDPDRLSGLVARSIGPAGTSGRATAIDAVVADPDTIWIGAAGGGVWRSTDGGLTWQPRFDDQPVHSIGALAIDQRQPDVVWVGTGEANLRNSVSYGDGVYRTRDGGETWQHLGLDRTEHVARILLDPRHDDVAYVCATGSPWRDNAERGVFKTSDGGKSWQKVLYVDAATGCGDLAMDPQNPDHLLAGMWQLRRTAWSLDSGGPGSGLHVSWDGGASWRHLQPEDGLPEGDLGRIGLAFAPSDARVVYALVEADPSELLRSADGGRTWATVNDDPRVMPRPFYFGQIRVDPRSPDRLYRLDEALWVSIDGGGSFATVGATTNDIHGDFHDLWIDPRDARLQIVAEDGGIAISRSGGDSFRFVGNLPLSQPYHVAVDDDDPYHVYVGLQDNGAWRGPSAVRQVGGIRNHQWLPIGDGDGFTAVPENGSSRRGYSLWQGGHVARWDLDTGEQRGIDPVPPAGKRLRFNWNAGFAVDPFDAATIYLGSQYLHRSRDRGATWEIVSPDLTTDNAAWQQQDESGGLTPDVTSAEGYTTIVAIAPSPRVQGLIWVGTDDGRVQVTRDAGATWTAVEGNLVARNRGAGGGNAGAPAHAWVAHVAASRHADGTAYVVLDDHRSGDLQPYAYATDDFGRTWRRLSSDGVRGYALAIAEDTVDPDLLFLGTELGLWASRDRGAHWTQLRWTLPTASVMDLLVHPRTGDLVIATHGRGVWILDDLSPLRTISPAVLREPLHLFTPPPAEQHWEAAEDGGFGFGAGEYRGENRPYGALLTWSLDGAGLPLPDPEKERQRREEDRLREAGETPAARLNEERPTAPVQSEESTPPAAPVLATTAGAGAAAAPAPAAGRGATTPPARAEEKPNETKEPEVVIEVADASGAVVRTLREPATLGVDRTVWDLRRDAPRALPSDAAEGEGAPPLDAGGPEVPPGDYTVTVRFRGKSASAPLRVLPDPRSTNTPAQWQERERAIRDLLRIQDDLTDAIWRVRRTRDDVALLEQKQRDRRKDAGEKDDDVLDDDPLVRAGDALLDKLDDLERTLWTPPEAKGIPAETDALSLVTYAASYPQSGLAPPTPNDLAWIQRARDRVDAARKDVDALLATDVAQFRRQAEAAGIGVLSAASP